MAPRHRIPPSMPSKETLLAYIHDQSGDIGTRELARAFGLKNADRAALKGMLRQLADEGQIEKRRKKLHRPGTLPPVVLTDIIERDRDGELIASPSEWDEAEHGPVPKIRIHVPRKTSPRDIPGVGDHALVRAEATGEPDDAIR
ncbi:MAG TPA: ribonuclease R, partial [Xanthobacteraceae bacterium]|nr:ribonuclease R [Xanthobacteraceae bacterium]